MKADRKIDGLSLHTEVDAENELDHRGTDSFRLEGTFWDELV